MVSPRKRRADGAMGVTASYPRGANRRSETRSVRLIGKITCRVSSALCPMKIKILSAAFLLAASPLALLASPEADRKIEAAAKESYNYRTILEDHVKVKARDGVVTLSGTVQDSDYKTLAQDTVENLPGVVRVNNEIKVKSEFAEHSDGWIALKIRSRLLVKANVSAATTKVNVTDGVVTLTGTVRTPAQKELTEAYAKDIDHVKSVRNELVVVDREGGENTVAEAIDDASITSQVKFALMNHRSTSALRTKVVTQDAVVNITGAAKSEAEKTLVTKLAEDIRGVKSVSNQMTVATKD